MRILSSRTRTEVTHCKVYSIYSIYYLGCGTLAACGVSLCCDLHQAVAVGNTAGPRRDDAALSTALSTEVQHSALSTLQTCRKFLPGCSFYTLRLLQTRFSCWYWCGYGVGLQQATYNKHVEHIYNIQSDTAQHHTYSIYSIQHKN